jgi:hypothetical protein
LCLEGTVESDVAEAQRGPSDKTSYSAEVEKPGEGLRSASGTKTYRVCQ